MTSQNFIVFFPFEILTQNFRIFSNFRKILRKIAFFSKKSKFFIVFLKNSKFGNKIYDEKITKPRVKLSDTSGTASATCATWVSTSIIYISPLFCNYTKQMRRNCVQPVRPGVAPCALFMS